MFEGVSNPNDIILVEDGNHPSLLTSYMRKEVEMETMCILNSILNFFPMWTIKIKDTIIWPSHRMRLLKYNAFLNNDNTKYKIILRKIINA
jgi:hypothetical protein